MNINVSIIDQFVTGLQNKIREQALIELGSRYNNSDQIKSLAFLFLCVQTWFGFETHDEVFDCITDGGDDFGIDAIYISDERDGEFNITIFQAKYKNDLEGNANFPANAIDKLTHAVRILFDLNRELVGVNDRLKVRIEEARALIGERIIPRVTIVACNNGKKWVDAADSLINSFDLGDQIEWKHLNHDSLLEKLQSKKPVIIKLQMSGKSFQDDVNVFRVIVGRLRVSEIAVLMKQYGERLLDRNIRRYLGLYGNRVNEGMRNTLLSENPGNFYLYNNGITLVCSKFILDRTQSEGSTVDVTDLQIVNGGQTCMTILRVSEELEKNEKSLPPYATVLVRIYELDNNKENEDVVFNITHATNSQNPVTIKELKSNDDVQIKLETSIKELGYNYVRKASHRTISHDDITVGNAAESILSVWLRLPNKAKFHTADHFGSLYTKIFNNKLNGAQTIIAVLVYRIAERHRRQAEVAPVFVRYASCYIAMQMGRRLLNEMGIDLSNLTHLSFNAALKLIENKGEEYYSKSVKDVENALRNFHDCPYNDLSLQQLSASFRREGLIDILLKIP
ncbi:MAG: AIPR family protein [Candidatus Symbiobacter sp.]|nr:AIPR family protein [Candidatus Symbiobacter sp.]